MVARSYEHSWPNYIKYYAWTPLVHGHLYSMKIIDSPACLCGFINENEFHFFLVCPLHNRPRLTVQNAMAHIAPFTLRTLFMEMKT